MADPLIDTWRTHDRITACLLTAQIAPGLAVAPEAGSRVWGFKPRVDAFVGSLLAHESHRRGQLAMVLKAAGTPLDRKVGLRIWKRGVR